MPRQQDQTSVICMQVAMTSTAFARKRNTHAKQQLFNAVHALLSHVPFSGRLMDREGMEHTVRAALVCGRAAGLTWRDMQIIFNEENEKVPPALPVAMANFERTIFQKGGLQ